MIGFVCIEGSCGSENQSGGFDFLLPPSCPMDPHASDDSSTEDDAASQTTEDDPQVPELNGQPAPPPPSRTAPIASSTARERPHYELRHTMRGHTKSISAVKFSPDGTLLASCGKFKAFLLLSASVESFLCQVQKIWSRSGPPLPEN